MKLAWFCIPAAGHTNPTLAVVRTLTDAGHQVRYYSFEAFREKIESAGAEFIPVDEYCAEVHLSPADGKRIATDTAFATKILADTTLAIDGAMLADCDAFLTHCGMNSVSEALYCGVPLVLFPQTAEQRGVANRTAELGAGMMLVEPTEAAIRAAVDAVVTDGKYREGAARIRKSFRACGGAQEAAEHILRAANS